MHVSYGTSFFILRLSHFVYHLLKNWMAWVSSAPEVFPINVVLSEQVL